MQADAGFPPCSAFVGVVIYRLGTLATVDGLDKVAKL